MGEEGKFFKQLSGQRPRQKEKEEDIEQVKRDIQHRLDES